MFLPDQDLEVKQSEKPEQAGESSENPTIDATTDTPGVQTSTSESADVSVDS